jgi:hypothetical protein
VLKRIIGYIQYIIMTEAVMPAVNPSAKDRRIPAILAEAKRGMKATQAR